jgi:hypothetical protein
MDTRRRRLLTLAAAIVAATGTLATTSPAEAGHRSRTACSDGYTRYDSSRYRGYYRARWQAGQYGVHYVRRGRVYSTRTAGCGPTRIHRYVRRGHRHTQWCGCNDRRYERMRSRRSCRR